MSPNELEFLNIISQSNIDSFDEIENEIDRSLTLLIEDLETYNEEVLAKVKPGYEGELN